MKHSNISVGKSLLSLTLSLISLTSLTPPSLSAPGRSPDQTVDCEILVVGGGLAGAGTAYEGLLAGKTVCLTEITDWVGGQISSQGTSALDERSTQRQRLFFPRGYLELRERIKRKYKELNPGDCWVSESCFFPGDGNEILYRMLRDAAKRGKGNLKWFPSTVIKEIERNSSGNIITGAVAIQHQPAKNAPPLNTFTLSETIEDSYKYENSSRFDKTIIRFVPKNPSQGNSPNWYVVEATETGEIIGLTDVPYRLGIDPRSHLEPSASSTKSDPYCTQGFTYTFTMEATKEPQTNKMPSFYPEYAPYYSYELKRLADFGLVFSYRRIWSPKDGEATQFGGINFTAPAVGDISMQNWTWGNDYRPGTSQDNLIYSRDQLQRTGQLSPSGWMGGLRTESLQKAEEKSMGYFYWLVAGTTDSQLGDGVKKPYPNYRYLSGLDSPMGTAHGLSKYPYMREGRRIIGRPSFGYEEGFTIWEIDMSRRDYREDYYKKTLSPDMYRSLFIALAGRETISAIADKLPPEKIKQRSRSTIYPDSVGIGHYAIDFHPCMTKSPAETPGNTEREGERQGAGQAYPFQIPLRAMIPQKIDNMLVAGKSIATSHVAAAAYRVHSFEWSSGVAAGTTAAYALEKGIMPYQLVDELPKSEPQLQELRQRLEKTGNPTAFPDTSIFNESWDAWR
ncbi:FAD-dependent oxidoreductase [Limnofasciculus baicalensis]|uniref:FAD-dependent oxidoreductase n=1 Tax=Limnofasciculus baicalensis BBK-W-15 TaxID=2699891 RepID=A0AAE3GTR7_9CYAN|nr:FAD-dependent oxidoreductase [Limnofasciculus baicalensis]MCP2729603.1 FAD-dependent oxidoreductase [Limnofasciculus baicalensis BBK-W-15]